MRKELREAYRRACETLGVKPRKSLQHARRCKGCNGDLDESTPGCRICWQRHYERAKRKK